MAKHKHECQHTYNGMDQDEHSWVLGRQSCHERAYLNAQLTFSMILFSLISKLLPLVWTAKNSQMAEKQLWDKSANSKDHLWNDLFVEGEISSLWSSQATRAGTYLFWTENSLHLLLSINKSCSVTFSRSFLFSRSRISFWVVIWSWNAFS